MRTLIELYDDRPIENVLATEIFRPERTVFLCPQEVAQSKERQNSIRSFFLRRGVNTECIFLETSLLYADKVEKQLARVLNNYPEPAVEITGGSDAALFACGRLCVEKDVPVFTYSRKKNRFFDIYHAEPVRGVQPDIRYKVEEVFLMAGGVTSEGRVNNDVLAKYTDFIPAFFDVYRQFHREWGRGIVFMQKISHTGGENPAPLTVHSSLKTKNGVTNRLAGVPVALLQAFESIGAIRDLSLSEEEGVSFTFADQQIRYWLRDVGSVLELYLYRQCLVSGLFNDVRTSVIVNWTGTEKCDAVTNELDVVAVRGIMPLFISCKTCSASTGALNELAVLRDRFGGPFSRAVLVTTQNCRAITRHRAGELGIVIFDWEDLNSGDITDNLRALF